MVGAGTGCHTVRGLTVESLAFQETHIGRNNHFDTVRSRSRIRHAHAPHTTHHALLITHHTPQTAHHAPRITHHTPHTTRATPRTTHHAVLTTHHTPHITQFRGFKMAPTVATSDVVCIPALSPRCWVQNTSQIQDTEVKTPV